MRVEILVEDASGKIMLEHLIPQIIGYGNGHKIRVINIQDLKHRVMSRMPRRLAKTLPWDSILFQTLSIQLTAYRKSFEAGIGLIVAVIVDLDYRNYDEFLLQMNELFCCSCEHKFSGNVFLAVEEGEAWLLGDKRAILKAYPFAKKYVLDSYVQDSICGTWEWLADAIFRGGSEKLTEIGYPQIGREKCQWADNIAKYMDTENNTSPSFITFRDGLKQLVNDKK
ncbi:MAG: hypothetical protein LBE18_02850 [Planctomycetaceae bacterium]|jgi:hypothetical protein|nr:hypothetical protein [Planctomycetaceae bacterium]